MRLGEGVEPSVGDPYITGPPSDGSSNARMECSSAR